MVIILTILVAAVLSYLGYLLREKKKYNLIPGYHMLSDEEKQEQNPEQMANWLGKLLYAMAGLLLLMGLLFLLSLDGIAYFISAFLFLLPLWCIYYLNHKKFQKK